MRGSTKKKNWTAVRPRIQTGLRAFLTPPGPQTPAEAYTHMATQDQRPTDESGASRTTPPDPSLESAMCPALPNSLDTVSSIVSLMVLCDGVPIDVSELFRSLVAHQG